ncbi:MAG: hypothetical protein AAFV95_25225 [Bacteroidota bacterium]
MNDLMKAVSCLLCFALLFSSCKKDRDDSVDLGITETPGTPQGNKLRDMHIPDGFDFKTSRAVQFGLQLQDSLGQEMDSVQYTITGISKKGEREDLYNGFTGASALINLQLDVPIHFENLLVKTTSGNTIKQFEFSTEDAIQDKIAVNGIISDKAQSRIDNCYPSLNTNFDAGNKSFYISSDQTINTVEVQYTDGTSEIIRVNGTSFNF